MYAKLFSSILDSSLWTADPPTRILFLTMLAMADREGRIFASRSGLARRAVIADDDFERALGVLEGPDAESSDMTRNPENGGRRVEPAEGGWKLINYQYYRDLRDMDERRLQDRERQKRHREKSRKVTKRHDRSHGITKVRLSDSEADHINSPNPPLRGNPRAEGTNPRALGTNPRAVATRQRAEDDHANRQGTIKTSADLSHFDEGPPEPLDEESAKMLREAIRKPGVKPMPGAEKGRREKLHEQFSVVAADEAEAAES